MNAAFWDMGGYALYVWGSYGSGLAIFVWNVLVPRFQRAALLRRLKENSE